MLFSKWEENSGRSYAIPRPDPGLDEALTADLSQSLEKLRRFCGGTADLQINRITASEVPMAFVMFEGLVNYQTLLLGAAGPLESAVAAAVGCSREKLPAVIERELFLSGDKKRFSTYRELIGFIASGFAALLIDGATEGIAFGVQGFSFRSVSEPSSETNLRGSREGFAEPIRINMSMVRRRMKTPSLCMKLLKLGEKSNTDVCILYRSDRAARRWSRRSNGSFRKPSLIRCSIRDICGPFSRAGPFSLFSGTNVTERPDTLCAKLSEGRIGILVDGSPFAVVVPTLFAEHFQSADDYSERPYYAVLMRLIKYLAFFLTMLLPGCYVAAVEYHPELLPAELLFRVAEAESGMAFPLMAEALFVHFLYELMREAGLRLPRPVGHAVSIIGALVIGDAAVTAGLVSTPMVMVVALTTISSFVVPSLYEPLTLLRLVFILLGGTLGLYGVVLGLCFVGANLCSVTVLGVPATSPEMPFSGYAMRDNPAAYELEVAGQAAISRLPHCRRRPKWTPRRRNRQREGGYSL